MARGGLVNKKKKYFTFPAFYIKIIFQAFKLYNKCECKLSFNLDQNDSPSERGKNEES